MSSPEIILSNTDTSDGGTNPSTTTNNYITETSTNNFITDVIEKSNTVPVIVDFWAPWCGPCKQLTPILEKVVNAANGAVQLVKLDIEKYPEIPGQLGIQSIPAVFAFKNGQPVDAFMGVVPENQIKAFIEKVTGPIAASESENKLAAAKQAVEMKDFSLAAQLFSSLLAEDPTNLEAIAGLAHCYVGTKEFERAKQTLETVPEDKKNDPAIVAALSAIDLAEQASSVGDLAELQAKVAENESDLQARMDLAIALNAKGRLNAAVDQLLEIIKQDREWDDDAGRKKLLQFFEVWGHSHPATIYGRKKLSSVLFS